MGRHPRQRGGRAVDGCQPRRVQDHGVRVLRRAHGCRRRALCAQDRLSRARHLKRAALDPVPAHGGGRRSRQPARRGLRRRLRRDAAGRDLPGAGRRPGLARPGLRRLRAGGRPRGVLARRPLRQAARARARHLRPDPRALHPVRAARRLRPLAEDRALLRDVPALQARDLQAPEGVHALGAPAVTFFAAERLAINFGGIRALDGVSFTVDPGQVFTIIGPNGAGKTTIFNLVSRIYDPSDGRLTFCGEDITRVSPHEIPRRGIARTFQNIELFEHATVLQNVLLGRHAHRRSRFVEELLFLPRVRALEIEHREAAEKVIDFLDLQRYRDSLIVNLPYGVRKVVEMARALCAEPKLLLLDEPSSGLSVEETEDMAFWIQDIRTLLGITVLMVEHDMSLVSPVSDRVLALNYGRAIALGTAREVQEHPDVITAYLGG